MSENLPWTPPNGSYTQSRPVQQVSASSMAPIAVPTVSSPRPLPSANGSLNTHAGLILTEDDITVEGMVLALLAELAARGYTLPPGLPVLPPDMPLEEAEAELAFLRSVFSLQRHRSVMDRFSPDLNGSQGPGRVATGAEVGGSILATNRPITPTNSSYAPTTPSTSVSSSGTLPARPSPLSSQSLDSTVLTSPSALFLAALLSLLISLQGEYRGTIQETDRGVDGELRMFKARRELGERLYAVVGGLLDSYLLTGDQPHESSEEEIEEDALVTLLFRDFPLNYDSMDRATC
ncbi:hypothetical protein JCM11641_006534, partial [Rhodosporidiobolus odoratus]